MPLFTVLCLYVEIFLTVDNVNNLIKQFLTAVIKPN